AGGARLAGGTELARGPGGEGLERRRFLIVGAGAAALGVAAGGLGNALLGRFSVASSRAAVRLPGPAVPAAAIPAGTDLRIPGLRRRAGVRAGADQVLSAATDGMTISTPVAAIMDGRNALLAVGMNGQPLPVAHGFPARMIVPGLYGYVSATKWVTKLTLTTFA